MKEFKDGVSLLKSKLEHLVHEERLSWTTYVTRYVEGGSAREPMEGCARILYEGLLGEYLGCVVSRSACW